MKNILNKSNGFTLIELAIVLVIIGVLIGSFIGTFTARIENIRVTETEDELEEIKKALLGYAYTNGHLPCPDCIGIPCNPVGFRDGIEDRGTGAAVAAGSCSTNNNPGSIPWITLGLKDRGDAWNTRYRYWVHETFSRDGSTLPVFTLDDPVLPFSADYPRMAAVFDRTVDGLGTQLIADNIVAFIFSHGKNRHGGYTIDSVFLGGTPAANVDEIENADNDIADPTVDRMIFIKRAPTSEAAATAGGEFDDIVEWLTVFELKAKMVEAGRLP